MPIATETRIVEGIAAARELTDSMFARLDPEAFYDRPLPERHRLLFYLGHLEAFDWNLLGRYSQDLASFHPTFDELFAFGIDPGEGQLPNEPPSAWPKPDEIRAYNRKARQTLDRNLNELPEQHLHVALEHRLMHAETLAYLFHNLPYERKRGPAPQVSPGKHPGEEMVAIPAGSVTLGLSPGKGFGWDNEFNAHQAGVEAFHIGKYKITNGEYLAFAREGGTIPFYWTERDGRYWYRGMFGEVPLPLDWPVYVTYRQAEAYCAWKGCRLPSEAEWQHTVYGRSTMHENPGISAAHGNYGFRRWDPESVMEDKSNGSSDLVQPIGNGWEWTSTEFGPFPGFQPFDFYQNYSEPFFDGDHYVLKGASPVTPAALIRPSFRNWFRPDYPYMYGTFRCVSEA